MCVVLGQAQADRTARRGGVDGAALLRDLQPPIGELNLQRAGLLRCGLRGHHVSIAPHNGIAALQGRLHLSGPGQRGNYVALLENMYGNTPRSWSGDLAGYKRLRFIINCLTRMRMLTQKGRLNFSHSGPPFRARKNLMPWYAFENRAWAGTRIVFGHWSALGLVVLPELISLDTGCIWGRQLSAVRLDKRIPRIVQVHGQT